MGVSAVPGSGKTQTLSALAADLIRKGCLEEGQEILIVTLVNSAVDNFTSRITQFLAPHGYFPGFGYRVRTLHGLAHDIVRERPGLVGLSSQFQISDERDREYILKEAAFSWLRSNPDVMDFYTDPTLDPGNDHKARMQKWPEAVISIANNFIRQAKDLQATPELIQQKLKGIDHRFFLLEAGIQIFHDYQRALNYRNSVDFDDLIRLALKAIQTDVDFLSRLRRRWPYILEDEAQDSNRLQEQILGLLAGENGNWVRVGDPNQAIYETFTTANPQFLINFRNRDDVVKQDLPQSGRSSISIIKLANYLSEWVQTQHPTLELRHSLTDPKILPTDRDDPQPNPPDNSRGITIINQKLTPEDEINKVVTSIKHWLPQHPDHTLAVLVPRNDRGSELAAALRKSNIEPIELLRSSQSTRQTANILSTILKHLADPTSPHKFLAVLDYLLSNEEKTIEKNSLQMLRNAFQSIKQTEDYLFPLPDRDWMYSSTINGLPPELLEIVLQFRYKINLWQAAVLLPIGQLILTISQEIFLQPSDLALAHALAQALEIDARQHPDWSLFEFITELDRIARSERKFLGFSEDDSGFDPNSHKGEVVIATIHKAKGLEWDRVYLLSVNNYDFPSVENHDVYIGEKYFVRGKLNLDAELISQLKSLISDDISGLYQEEGEATRQARIDYASERLRLLYVGITRARRELVITWNTGRYGNCTQALPLKHMADFLELHKNGAND